MAQALSTESAKPPRRAFISHATADDSYVAEMESFLRAAGFDDVFNDASAIRPDERFWPAIEQGIAASEALVVVITAASNASDWVTREVTFARSLGRKVIPVWIEDCPVPALFADRDVIDFRPRRRAERRLDIGRIFQYAPEVLIGRDAEKARISDAWARALRAEAGRPHVLTFVALGGEGKTSLVAKWAVDEMLAKGWPGCDAAFAWSFYSQGTRDQVAGSSDVFLKTALDFFGDEDDRAFAASPAGAYEKGQRLARVVGRQRCLLILDGLEPLQYAPTAPTGSTLKDQGIAALLKGLAQQSQGLCLTTTRYSVPDLKAFRQSTATEVELLRLSTEAGAHLLTSLGITGTANERNALVEDVKGHALTLNLFGSWLRDAHNGDIRQRHFVKLEEADAEVQGGHAFRVMDAYEASLEREGDRGRRALSLLRLLGLFDRPITADCFDALLKPPAISGLTDPLVNLSSGLFNLTLNRLESARLLTVHRESGLLVALDAHPLLREYFASQLCEQHFDGWQLAHRRLYEHLRDTTKEGDTPTLEDLQPLFQAVGHGCLAGLQQQTCDEIYQPRILRIQEDYPEKVLGSPESDLSALKNFFDRPWDKLSKNLPQETQAWLFNQVSIRLSSVGQLGEAINPMRRSVSINDDLKDFESAAVCHHNLSELELTIGEIHNSAEAAKQSLLYAEYSSDRSQRVLSRAAFANSIYQAGFPTVALLEFEECERIQKSESDHSKLVGIPGFNYCDLLLKNPEQVAWEQQILGNHASAINLPDYENHIKSVAKRAHYAITTSKINKWRMNASLDHLTLGRTALLRYILSTAKNRKKLIQSALEEVHTSTIDLRRSGQKNAAPLILLTQAWIHASIGRSTGPDSAQADLDEAWDIAERGPMRLFMADIHLYRARLFFREAHYPWESPEADLKAARELIDRCGYGRRREELEDAETALAQWRQNHPAPT